VPPSLRDQLTPVELGYLGACDMHVSGLGEGLVP
jgi:hypothetical protein